MKLFFRILIWLGFTLIFGPGTSLDNSYDQVFLIGGLTLAVIGFIGILTFSRQDLPDVKYKPRFRQVKDRIRSRRLK